jgi:MFS transporter, OFA family, oxalate/formate antiporter
MLSWLRAPLAWLYAGYAMLALLGAGTLPVVFGRAITGWFVHSRGFALGLSLLGTGIVGALLPSFVSALVTSYGWRHAYLGLAALPLVLGLPFTLVFFRDPPEDAGPRAATVAGPLPLNPQSFRFGEALRSFGFWQISLSFMVVAIAVSAVLSHTQPLLVDRGVPAGRAAALLGLFGIAVSCGRLVSGYLLDVWRGPLVACAMFAAPALACLLLWLAGNNLVLCGLAIVLVGVAGGAEHDIAGFFVAKYFGRAHFAAIYGLLYALYGLGGGFGPLLAGAVYDATGNYDPALLGGVAVFVIAAAMIGSLKTPRRPPEPVPVA